MQCGVISSPGAAACGQTMSGKPVLGSVETSCFTSESGRSSVVFIHPSSRFPSLPSSKRREGVYL